MIRAAKYLGVSPWELAEQPITWVDWALGAEAAEEAARRKAEEQAAKRKK